jgi:hypothetical protein
VALAWLLVKGRQHPTLLRSLRRLLVKGRHMTPLLLLLLLLLGLMRL